MGLKVSCKLKKGTSGGRCASGTQTICYNGESSHWETRCAGLRRSGQNHLKGCRPRGRGIVNASEMPQERLVMPWLMTTCLSAVERATAGFIGCRRHAWTLEVMMEIKPKFAACLRGSQELASMNVGQVWATLGRFGSKQAERKLLPWFTCAILVTLCQRAAVLGKKQQSQGHWA